MAHPLIGVINKAAMQRRVALDKEQEKPGRAIKLQIKQEESRLQRMVQDTIKVAAARVGARVTKKICIGIGNNYGHIIVKPTPAIKALKTKLAFLKDSFDIKKNAISKTVNDLQMEVNLHGRTPAVVKAIEKLLAGK
jgi:hypothetical protein